MEPETLIFANWHEKRNPEECWQLENARCLRAIFLPATEKRWIHQKRKLHIR